MAGRGRRPAIIVAALLLAFGTGPTIAASSGGTGTAPDRASVGTPPDQARGFPNLTISPSVGPPGTVVQVTGSFFPGLRAVQLSWSVGVQYVPLQPVLAQDNSRFTAQFMVVPGDEAYGLRYLVASVETFGVAAPAAWVAVANAPFIMTEHTARPPSSKLFRGFSRSGQIIFR